MRRHASPIDKTRARGQTHAAIVLARVAQLAAVVTGRAVVSVGAAALASDTRRVSAAGAARVAIAVRMVTTC